MGGDCSNLCRHPDNQDKESPFIREPKSDSENYQLPINLKTSRALPEEYFSVSPSEMLQDVPAESIVKCEDNVMIIKFPSGVIYHGEISRGVRNGFGTQTWPDNAIYVGQWVDNKPNGQGKFTHPSGDYYEGNWVESKAEGLGKYVKQNGDVYKGDWKDDEPSGYGEESTIDGSVYKGQFKNGFKHGKGVF